MNRKKNAIRAQFVEDYRKAADGTTYKKLLGEMIESADCSTSNIEWMIQNGRADKFIINHYKGHVEQWVFNFKAHTGVINDLTGYMLKDLEELRKAKKAD